MSIANCCAHAHHQPQYAGAVRAAIHQLTNKHGPASHRVRRVHGSTSTVPENRVAESVQLAGKLPQAVWDVPNHVKRTCICSEVVEKRFPSESGLRNFCLTGEDVDFLESFPAQGLERAPLLFQLPANDTPRQAPGGKASGCPVPP